MVAGPERPIASPSNSATAARSAAPVRHADPGEVEQVDLAALVEAPPQERGERPVLGAPVPEVWRLLHDQHAQPFGRLDGPSHPGHVPGRVRSRRWQRDDPLEQWVLLAHPEVPHTHDATGMDHRHSGTFPPMDWLSRDAAAVWHPFTQHSLWTADEPTVIDRAEGPWLFDVDGNRYLDGVSSLWVTTFGHRTPEIDAAIRAQLDRLDHATFLGATHTPGIELAERLLALAPDAVGATAPDAVGATAPDAVGATAPDAVGGLAPKVPSEPDPTDPGPKHPEPTDPAGPHEPDPIGPDEPAAGPRLGKVFFAGDGSSAVEVALKMAYQHSVQAGTGPDGGGRPLFVHLQEAYHGDTLGAVSVGGIELFHAAYRPLLLETVMVGSPGLRKPGQSRADRAAEAARELAGAMERHGERVCAIVVEPMVQAAAGMLTYDAHFLREARRLATAYGALLVCDEVATGIGRTGRMWGVEHAGIVPDLLTCGKGLTGGYLPLSAVLATDEVYRSFLGSAASGRTFFHGHTYTANPLCCAAANANLDLVVTRGLVASAAALGERLGALLAPLERHDGVLEVRRIGAMIGVEVRSVGERTGVAVCRAARRRGVWLRPLGDTVVVMPPLALGGAETELLAGALVEAVDEVVR
jgi:adenosylmethionine-8-amino-7-oxononanoate aminotransferase